jgi:hypothetical protein
MGTEKVAVRIDSTDTTREGGGKWDQRPRLQAEKVSAPLVVDP